MKTKDLVEILGEKTEVTLTIFKFEGNLNVRVVNSSKKFKKFFNRKYGTGKQVAKALLKNGLKEGLNTITLKEFQNIDSEIDSKSRINRALKFVKKGGFTSMDDIPCEEMPICNKKTKVKIKILLES